MSAAPLTVSSVNVNGVRAAAKKGLLQWLHATPAQVVCLQETRADDAQLAATLAPVLAEGWHLAHAASAAKGRNGVAVLSRQAPSAVTVGHGDPEFADAGRYLEVSFGDVAVASLYLPSGEAGTPRQDEKERFMDSFAGYLASVAGGGRQLVVCGDWNIAHAEADLKNWKTNHKNSGFLPSERQWLGAVYEGGAWVDVVRALHPGVDGPYTWWSFRGKAFDNDAGWRIDLHVATADTAARAVSAVVERAGSYDARWSDHAPVTVTYAF